MLGGIHLDDGAQLADALAAVGVALGHQHDAGLVQERVGLGGDLEDLVVAGHGPERREGLRLTSIDRRVTPKRGPHLVRGPELAVVGGVDQLLATGEGVGAHGVLSGSGSRGAGVGGVSGAR